VDFDELFKSLSWISTYTSCFGCEESGGSLDYLISRCAREKIHEICSECQEVEGCDRFQWLGEYRDIEEETE
jgi:hypothetical protein